jgi:hypothetical protein
MFPIVPYSVCPDHAAQIGETRPPGREFRGGRVSDCKRRRCASGLSLLPTYGRSLQSFSSDDVRRSERMQPILRPDPWKLLMFMGKLARSVEVDIDFQHRVAKLYDSSPGQLELSCLEHGE